MSSEEEAIRGSLISAPILTSLMAAISPVAQNGTPRRSNAEAHTPERAAAEDLPQYTVLRVVEFAGLGKVASVIISFYHRDLPVGEIETAVRMIAAQKGFRIVNAYQNAEAASGDSSASFRQANPGVLEAGLLGILNEVGEFVPAESIYPNRG